MIERKLKEPHEIENKTKISDEEKEKIDHNLFELVNKLIKKKNIEIMTVMI